MRTIRVLLEVEDPLARHGLSTLLESEEGVEVAASADPHADLSDAVDASMPDVVCADLGGERGGALERVRDLAAAGPPLLVLVDADLPARPLLAAGARATLRRDVSAERLAAAVRAAAAGLIVIDPAFADFAAGETFAEDEDVSAEELTPRELEVLSLLSLGLSNRGIAERLKISEHTAKFHVNAILGKLGAASRAEAIVRAARRGLVIL